MLDATCSISCSMLLIFLSKVHHIYQTCNTSADVLSGKRLVGFYIILKRTRQSSQFPHMRTDSPSYGEGDKSHYINLKHFLVQCRSFTITWYEDRTPPWVQSRKMPQRCPGPTLPCSQENSKHHTGNYWGAWLVVIDHIFARLFVYLFLSAIFFVALPTGHVRLACRNASQPYAI